MYKPPINICKNAVQHLKKIALDSPISSIMIGVRGGGCNGLKYYIEPLLEKPTKLDEKMTTDGLDIVICGGSLIHLIGTELTWEKNYMGEGFNFKNPNALGTCGCGETFSI